MKDKVTLYTIEGYLDFKVHLQVYRVNGSKSVTSGWGKKRERARNGV